MIEKSLLSQEAFAQAVGVSFTTVNRWESGKCKPTFKTMKLIDDFCKAQGIDFNISDELIDKIFYRNAFRFFRNYLKNQ